MNIERDDLGSESDDLPQQEGRIKLEPLGHKRYQDFLETRIIGQSEATEAFSKLAVRIKSGIREPSGIIDSKFLAGPSGVGKTEITLTLARLFDESDGPPKVIKVDCGLLQQEHEMSRLVGSPPGYVGSEGSSGYIEPVLSPENIEENAIEYTDAQGRKQKLVIIIFDEFEKAHPALQKLLLVSLDKGTIETASNRFVDLSSSVILFTSNIGNQKVEEQREANPIGFGQGTRHGSVRDTVLSEMREAFPPEFRGRVNDVIIFNYLTREVAVSIAKIKLDEVEEVFRRNGINIKLSPSESLLDYLAERGLNPSEGARAIIKLIKGEITDNLIAAHADFNINNSEIVLDIDEGGKPALYFGEKIPEPETRAVTQSSNESKKKRSKSKQPKRPDKLPKEPIEVVQARLLAKLQAELERLNGLPDEEKNEPPLIELMKNIEYINSLADEIPELFEYMQRRQLAIKIGTGPFQLFRKSSIVLDYESPRFSKYVAYSKDYDCNNLYFNLSCRPDMHSLLADLTSVWDQGRRHGITQISNLSKKDIVREIMMLREHEYLLW